MTTTGALSGIGVEKHPPVGVDFRGGTRLVGGIAVDGGSAMYYLTGLPARIPGSLVLVHNWVPQHSPAVAGPNGWRFWLQAQDDRLSPCRCRWASRLGRHYTRA